VRLEAEAQIVDSAEAFGKPHTGKPQPIETDLTLEPLSFSSGVPSRYRVLGLPDGQTAEIAYRVIRSIEVWKIKRDTGKLAGVYTSAEEALNVLQRQTEVGALTAGAKGE
jgi:hypothetical protein